MTYPTFRGRRPREEAETAASDRRCPRCAIPMMEVPNTAAHAKLCTDCKDVLPREEWHHWGYANIEDIRATNRAKERERHRAKADGALQPYLCLRCKTVTRVAVKLCATCRGELTEDERAEYGYATNRVGCAKRRQRIAAGKKALRDSALRS